MDAVDGGPVAPWIWVLLVVSLLVAGAVVVLVPRARRRREWASGLAAAEAEVGWVAHELLPGLQVAATPDVLEAGWHHFRPRLDAAEQSLSTLADTARDEPGRARAAELGEALRTTRGAVVELVEARLPGPRTAELSLLAAQLEAVLAQGDPSTA